VIWRLWYGGGRRSPPLRYRLAFVVPLVVTILLTPIAGRLARRLGILDHPSEQKFHRDPTPYLGGVALAGGLAAIGFHTTGASAQVFVILLGGLVIGALGLVDDWVTVRPSLKLLVQGSAGVALWFADVRAGLFGVEALDLALTVLWVVAVINAVNLLDNMDGLTAGVSAVAAFAFFGIAAARGEYLVASFALAVAGASLGFLRYNLPPATIFLGDAGALMLGFLLAALGLKLDLVGENGLVRSAVPILILGVPLFDMLLVIVDRLRGRRPVFRGATDHSSHRLSALGISHGAVAALIVAAEVICCALALTLLQVSFDPAVAIAIVTGLIAIALLVLLLQVQPSAAGTVWTVSSALRVPRETDR
jgi:UDP-GlcNAc:undecaprenyl-phosphate/decaprenyl-phosphate GlcNAc-1-phosphate transferase